MTFDGYLAEKKINSDAFRVSEPELWTVWKAEFEQMSEGSFTSRKLYLINALRRKYHFIEQQVKPAAPAAKPRPIIKPKTS